MCAGSARVLPVHAAREAAGQGVPSQGHEDQREYRHYSTVQYTTVQYSTAQYRAVQTLEYRQYS